MDFKIDLINQNSKKIEVETISSVPDALFCLGTRCPHVCYKMCDGALSLWCDKIESPVLEIQECPDSCWTKNGSGFPSGAFDVENLFWDKS